MSSKISESFIDIQTVGDFKLCCYSNCLVFGKPIYENFHLRFASDTYIKIFSHQYFRYFDFFSNVLQITKEVQESEENVENSISNSVLYVYQTKENVQTKVLIQAKYKNKITFILNLEEIFQFFIGFRNICFKVFTYPIKIEEFIFRMLHSHDLTYLKNIIKQEYVTLHCLDEFNKNETVLLLQVILRHHTLLLKIKCSMENFPDELDL